FFGVPRIASPSFIMRRRIEGDPMGRPYESRRPRRNMVGHTPDQGLAMSAQLQAVEAATDIAAVMRELGSRARQAARVLALAPTQQKDDALAAMADEIRAGRADILAANAA